MSILFLDYIVPASVLLPLLIFISKRGKWSSALKVLFVYLIVSSLMNIAGVLLAHRNLPNLWLMHIYTIVEITLLLLFFLKISDSVKAKKGVKALMLIFPIAGIINVLFFQSAGKFDSYIRCTESLVFVFLCVNYWFRNRVEPQYVMWTQDPYNWVVSGILLYFSSSFLLFLFSNSILTDARRKSGGVLMDIILVLWTAHGILVIIQYILFSVSFSKYKHGR